MAGVTPGAEIPSALPNDIRESVAATNLKVLGNAPAFYANLAMANAVQVQHQLSQVGLAIVAKAVDAINRASPENQAALTALGQIMTKAAGNTPPETPAK